MFIAIDNRPWEDPMGAAEGRRPSPLIVLEVRDHPDLDDVLLLSDDGRHDVMLPDAEDGFEIDDGAGTARVSFPSGTIDLYRPTPERLDDFDHLLSEYGDFVVWRPEDDDASYQERVIAHILVDY